MTARSFTVDLIPGEDGLGYRVTRDRDATRADALRAACALLRAFAVGAEPEGRIAMASLARLAGLEETAPTGPQGDAT